MAKLTNEIITEIVALLHESFSTASLSNITGIVVKGMEVVGAMEDLSGKVKKGIVMDSTIRFIDDTDAMGVLEPIVLEMIPFVIDNLIAADKNQLVLHPQIKKTVYRCFGLKYKHKNNKKKKKKKNKK